MGDSGGLQQAKLVLLGDMGAGKSSLVLRFVKGQFFDYQASTWGYVTPLPCLLSARSSIFQDWSSVQMSSLAAVLQESTIGAAFLTKTMPEQNVKFEIWCVCASTDFDCLKSTYTVLML